MRPRFFVLFVVSSGLVDGLATLFSLLGGAIGLKLFERQFQLIDLALQLLDGVPVCRSAAPKIRHGGPDLRRDAAAGGDIAGFQLVPGILQGGCLFSQLRSLPGDDRLQGSNVVRERFLG